MNWTQYWIGMAQYVATKSKDESTQCGAVIVDEHQTQIATGYNGFPRGIDDNNPEYHKRPLKYDYTEHAERNAIYQAAASRGGTRGATIYLGHSPYLGICTGCARAIIQAQIKQVVGPNITFTGKGPQWEKNMRTAFQMLKEAGVDLFVI